MLNAQESLEPAASPPGRNGAMARAILAGTKAQTRRIAKGITDDICYVGLEGHDGFVPLRDDGKETPILCPFGGVGMKLWVRETWAPNHAALGGADIKAFYRADGVALDGAGDRRIWKPSIHMPRWASRLTLEVTGVRLERLQAITEADARAEGCGADDDPFWHPSYADPDSGGNPSARNSFEYLWHEINGAKSWMENPFVWVVSFKRIPQASVESRLVR